MSQSGKKATIHTGTTFRSQEQKRKTVFKAVLNSPYSVKWPEVSLEDQKIILEELCNLLSVTIDYNRRKREYKKNVNKLNKQKDEAKVNYALSTMDVDLISFKTEDLMTIDDTKTVTSRKSIHLPSPPSILSCIVIGINSVTKHLERTINPEIKANFERKYTQGFSNTLISTNPKTQIVNHSSIIKQSEPLRMIFVCKADISPPHLCAHLPIMSFLAKNILLVPLPSGAAELIGKNLGIRQASCIGIKINTPEFDKIYELAKDKVGHINAPWLAPFNSEISKKRKCFEEDEQDEIVSSRSTINDFMKTTCNEYVPTQIKQLVTSAPIKKFKAWNQEKQIKGKAKATQTKKL